MFVCLSVQLVSLNQHVLQLSEAQGKSQWPNTRWRVGNPAVHSDQSAAGSSRWADEALPAFPSGRCRWACPQSVWRRTGAPGTSDQWSAVLGAEGGASQTWMINRRQSEKHNRSSCNLKTSATKSLEDARSKVNVKNNSPDCCCSRAFWEMQKFGLPIVCVVNPSVSNMKKKCEKCWTWCLVLTNESVLADSRHPLQRDVG